MIDYAAAQTTLVERLYAGVTDLTAAAAQVQPDDTMNQTLDALFATLTRLAHAPALNPTDLDF